MSELLPVASLVMLVSAGLAIMLLDVFAKGRADAVEAASRLIRAWRDFLAAAEADVASKREAAGLEELSQNAQRVSLALEGLREDLRALEDAP